MHSVYTYFVYIHTYICMCKVPALHKYRLLISFVAFVRQTKCDRLCHIREQGEEEAQQQQQQRANALDLRLRLLTVKASIEW